MSKADTGEDKTNCLDFSRIEHIIELSNVIDIN